MNIEKISSNQTMELATRLPKNRGKLGDIPVSHDGEAGKALATGITSVLGSLAGSAILILGIVFWVLGASNGNASMLLAGKVLTGIAIASSGLGLIACCCVCCCAAAVLPQMFNESVSRR